MRFTEDSWSIFNKEVGISSLFTLRNLSALHIHYRPPGNQAPLTNRIIQSVIDAAPNLASLSCLICSNSLDLRRLPEYLRSLEVNWVLPDVLARVNSTLRTLRITYPTIDLFCNANLPTFPQMRELEITDPEELFEDLAVIKLTKSRDIPPVGLTVLQSFPKLEKFSSGCCKWNGALAFTYDFFLHCREQDYQGLKIVKLCVPNSKKQKNWSIFRDKVIPNLPHLKRLHLRLRPENVRRATLQVLLNISVPHLVLEGMNDFVPWKREEAAFRFGKFFRCCSTLSWIWGNQRGEMLEIRGGRKDAEEYGEIDPAQFSAALRKLQEGWKQMQMGNFMVRFF